MAAFPKSSMVKDAQNPDGRLRRQAGLRTRNGRSPDDFTQVSYSPALRIARWPSTTWRCRYFYAMATGGHPARALADPPTTPPPYIASYSCRTDVDDKGRPGLGHAAGVQGAFTSTYVRISHYDGSQGCGVDPRDPGRLTRLAVIVSTAGTSTRTPRRRVVLQVIAILGQVFAIY